MEIQAVSSNIEEVGKYVSNTKKRFTWHFKADAAQHTIVATFSFVSGKVKIVVSGSTILDIECDLDKVFQHSFMIGKVSCTLFEQNGSCQLRLNNKVFSHLLINAKSKSEFTYEKQTAKERPDQFVNKFEHQFKGKLKLSFESSKDDKAKKGISKFNQFSKAAQENIADHPSSAFSFQDFARSKQHTTEAFNFGQFQAQAPSKQAYSQPKVPVASSPPPPPPPAPKITKPVQIDLLGGFEEEPVLTKPQSKDNEFMNMYQKKDTIDPFADLLAMPSQPQSHMPQIPSQMPPTHMPSQMPPNMAQHQIPPTHMPSQMPNIQIAQHQMPQMQPPAASQQQPKDIFDLL